MKKRSIVSLVLLDIITCGIYGLVIAYQMFTDMEKEGVKSKVPPC